MLVIEFILLLYCYLYRLGRLLSEEYDTPKIIEDIWLKRYTDIIFWYIRYIISEICYQCYQISIDFRNNESNNKITF